MNFTQLKRKSYKVLTLELDDQTYEIRSPCPLTANGFEEVLEIIRRSCNRTALRKALAKEWLAFIKVKPAKGLVIEVTNPPGHYHAMITSYPDKQGSGSSVAEALGELLLTHAASFGVTVVVDVRPK